MGPFMAGAEPLVLSLLHTKELASRATFSTRKMGRGFPKDPGWDPGL